MVKIIKLIGQIINFILVFCFYFNLFAQKFIILANLIYILISLFIK